MLRWRNVEVLVGASVLCVTTVHATPPTRLATALLSSQESFQQPDDVLRWLRTHSGEVQRALAAQFPTHANQELLIEQGRAEWRRSVGNSWVLRGDVFEQELWVVTIPVITVGTAWIVKGSRVVVGYTRPHTQATEHAVVSAMTMPDGAPGIHRDIQRTTNLMSERLSVQDAIQPSDQPIFAGTIQLLIDRDGTIYY